MGSVYERELKKLLTANRFLVVRAAGSLGVDLVAINSNVAFPIEVKASRTTRLQFSACSGRA
jgi:Holliday junction resolvase